MFFPTSKSIFPRFFPIISKKQDVCQKLQSPSLLCMSDISLTTSRFLNIDKSIWHYRKVDVAVPSVIIKIGGGRKKMKME